MKDIIKLTLQDYDFIEIVYHLKYNPKFKPKQFDDWVYNNNHTLNNIILGAFDKLELLCDIINKPDVTFLFYKISTTLGMNNICSILTNDEFIQNLNYWFHGNTMESHSVYANIIRNLHAANCGIKNPSFSASNHYDLNSLFLIDPHYALKMPRLTDEIISIIVCYPSLLYTFTVSDTIQLVQLVCDSLNPYDLIPIITIFMANCLTSLHTNPFKLVPASVLKQINYDEFTSVCKNVSIISKIGTKINYDYSYFIKKARLFTIHEIQPYTSNYCATADYYGRSESPSSELLTENMYTDLGSMMKVLTLDALVHYKNFVPKHSLYVENIQRVISKTGLSLFPKKVVGSLSFPDFRKYIVEVYKSSYLGTASPCSYINQLSNKEIRDLYKSEPDKLIELVLDSSVGTDNTPTTVSKNIDKLNTILNTNVTLQELLAVYIMRSMSFSMDISGIDIFQNYNCNFSIPDKLPSLKSVYAVISNFMNKYSYLIEKLNINVKKDTHMTSTNVLQYALRYANYAPDLELSPELSNMIALGGIINRTSLNIFNLSKLSHEMYKSNLIIDKFTTKMIVDTMYVYNSSTATADLKILSTDLWNYLRAKDFHEIVRSTENPKFMKNNIRPLIKLLTDHPKFTNTMTDYLLLIYNTIGGEPIKTIRLFNTKLEDNKSYLQRVLLSAERNKTGEVDRLYWRSSRNVTLFAVRLFATNQLDDHDE